MRRITSSYKIFGGFGLFIILNGLIAIGTVKVVTDAIANSQFWNDSNAQNILLSVVGMQVSMLWWFSTQNRFIYVENDAITFVNPVLPFIVKTKKWADFDYFISVDEQSNHTSHEAVWLVKDGKLAARFSSFYYANYDELKQGIMTKNRGKRDFNPFSQLFVLLGLKKIKI
jgi:hypothetical protein